MKKSLFYLLLTFLFLFPSKVFSQGTDCSSADPFCTGTTYNFPNTTGGTDLGAIDCLGSSPNPAWYFMEIDQNGPMTIQIDQTSSGGSGLDVDFALFGPYSSLAAACATIPGGNVVDCSYSTAATEFADIPNAQVGEIYVLLLTNFSNQSGNIEFSQSSGTGSADCSFICGITGFTAVPSACDPSTNTYSVSGTLSITNPPSSGTATITSSCGGTQVYNAPFGSSLNYNFTGLTSNGANCTVSVTFSADPNCNTTTTYTAPASCLVSCSINFFDANISACDVATNTYTVDGQVQFTGAPATGQMIVETCGGNQVVFNAPFVSPINYNITGIPADGTTNCDVTVYFTADPSCTMSIGPYTEPICPCNMDNMFVNIGACDPSNNTFTVTVDLDFTSPPASGSLQVTVCGVTQNLPMPATSPQTFTFSGLPADGSACSADAFFTADPACGNTLNFTSPNGCLCPTDAGTFTDNMNGSSNNNQMLCWNDALDITADGNFVPSDDFTVGWTPPPAPVYDPGLWLAVYDCPPSVFPPNDLLTDPCFLGIYSTTNGNWSILNNVGDGSTLYFVPITMYSMTDGIYAIAINGGDWCWDMGEVFPITFLEEITATGVEDCASGTVTVTVNGGTPALNGSSFTASNLSPATATFNNTTCTDGGTIVISGLQNGDMYSFDIVDNTGCPITYSGGPFVGPVATVISPAGPFCLSDPSVNLTVAPAVAGSWSGTGITNAATGTFDPATAGVGTFTITFTPSGCYLPSTTNITVNDVFDATINPVGPYCENDAAVTLTAADPGGTWSGTGITNASTGTFDPSVAGVGTWTITYAIGGSCGDTQTTTITVNPLADPTITPAGPFCDTDPAVTLSAAQSGGTWSGTGITNASTGTFDPGIAGPGSWTVTYTIAGACGALDTETILVSTQYDATISPAGPFCASNANTFLGAADPGGTWSGTGIVNASTGEFSPSVAGPGTWTITYTIAGSCGDVGTTTIQVIADADATINPAGPFCITDPTVNLTAAQAGGVWSGTGITSSANGTFDPATAGAGTWTITYNISGVCGDQDTETIIVNPLIPSTINPAGPFCENDNAVTLTAANPGGTWSGTGITNAATGTFDPAVAGPGTWTITYTISGSCGTTSTVDIVVNPIPVPTFIADVTSGCAPLTVTFFDNTVPAAATSEWYIDGVLVSTSNGGFVNTFTSPGTYSVSVTLVSAQGCEGTTTINNMITVYPNPVADFIFGPDDASVMASTINFTNQSTGADSYLWDFGGLGSSTQTNPSFTFPTDNPSMYTVCLEASTVNGCVDSTCQTIIIHDVFIIYVPNAFTPDNDQINDVFLPIVSGLDPESYHLMIFDRWGELIFETTDYQESWDGYYRGILSQEDVYVWKINLKDAIYDKKHEYIGHVTLLK